MVDVGDEDILDVDHADDLIEAAAVDRQAAVPGLREGADEIVEADVARHRDDVAAGHAYVARGFLPEVEEIAKHLPLDRAEVAGNRSRTAALLGFVDRLLNLLAERRLGLIAEDQVAHAPPEGRAAALVAARRHQ